MEFLRIANITLPFSIKSTLYSTYCIVNYLLLLLSYLYLIIFKLNIKLNIIIYVLCY